MSTHAPRPRPRCATKSLTLADEQRLLERSAEIHRRCAPDNVVLAGDMGVARTQPWRWSRGDKASPIYRALEFVTVTSRGENTTPAPLIHGLDAEASRVLLEERPTKWLIIRWHELRSRTPLLDAAEEITGHGRDRSAYRQALRAEADAQHELADIDEILEKRNIQPRDYRGDGWRQQP